MSVKPRTNFTLDALLFVLMLAVVISGLVLWVVLPSGSASGAGQGQGRRWQTETTTAQRADASVAAPDTQDNRTERSLILSRQDWKTLHDWLGLGVGVAILVHIVFHWKWITCRLRTDVLRRTHSRSPRPAVCPE